MDERLSILLEVIGLEYKIPDNLNTNENVVDAYLANECVSNNTEFEAEVFGEIVEESSVVEVDDTEDLQGVIEHSIESESEMIPEQIEQEDVSTNQDFTDLDNQEDLANELLLARDTTAKLLDNLGVITSRNSLSDFDISPEMLEYKNSVSRIDKEILQKEMLGKRIKVNNQKLSEEAFEISYSASRTILRASSTLELEIEDDIEAGEEISKEESENFKKKGLLKRFFDRKGERE